MDLFSILKKKIFKFLLHKYNIALLLEGTLSTHVYAKLLRYYVYIFKHINTIYNNFFIICL